jgi:TatA/E family protein of Tat protein translocase
VFDLSLPKLLVLGVLALLIFGPDQLPKFAAQAGRAIRELRRLAEGAQADLRENLGPEFSDFDIADLHPSLLGRLDVRCEPFDAERLKAKGVQVAFGCLPHGTSMESIPPLLERDIRVIDLSADYRLRDPRVYEEWYKEPHQDAANLVKAVYGLPEVYGDAINIAKLVANPGCYPQTAILGLAPLIADGLIELSGIIVDSSTQSPSMNGRSAGCIADSSGSNGATAIRPPKASAMAQALRSSGRWSSTTAATTKNATG